MDLKISHIVGSSGIREIRNRIMGVTRECKRRPASVGVGARQAEVGIGAHALHCSRDECDRVVLPMFRDVPRENATRCRVGKIAGVWQFRPIDPHLLAKQRIIQGLFVAVGRQ